MLPLLLADITEYGVSVTNVINAADEHPTNSTATLIREVQRMGRRGITWALIYWCYCKSDTRRTPLRLGLMSLVIKERIGTGCTNGHADVPYANATDFVGVMDAAYAAGVGIIWDFSKSMTVHLVSQALRRLPGLFCTLLIEVICYSGAWWC